MPSLFENAVASIRMGVEDFRQQDADRNVSAVRNLYAGVLLLAKEAIVRKAPGVDPSLLIAGKTKPLPDGQGGVVFQQVGHSTVDYQQVVQRAKDFGIVIDGKALERINRIRNDMEHHFTTETPDAIREAISKGFPVVASLFRQMDEDPLSLLEDAWQHMLRTKDLYDQEVSAARATYSGIQWNAAFMGAVTLICPGCRSEMLAQDDPDNSDQAAMELTCRSCGDQSEIEVAIEYLVDDIYGGEAYSRAKDSDGDGPVYDCPACDRHALIEGTLECAVCGEVLDYDSECARCSSGIGVQEYLDGLDGGLCGYCQHVTDKVMAED